MEDRNGLFILCSLYLCKLRYQEKENHYLLRIEPVASEVDWVEIVVSCIQFLNINWLTLSYEEQLVFKKLIPCSAFVREPFICISVVAQLTLLAFVCKYLHLTGLFVLTNVRACFEEWFM